MHRFPCPWLEEINLGVDPDHLVNANCADKVVKSGINEQYLDPMLFPRHDTVAPVESSLCACSFSAADPGHPLCGSSVSPNSIVDADLGTRLAMETIARLRIQFPRMSR